MKIHFHLHYRTNPGETLHVLVYREGAQAHEHKINIPLANTNDDLWAGEIELLLDRTLRLNYHYEVRCNKAVERRESQRVRRVLELKPNVKNYFMHDYWRDAAGELNPAQTDTHAFRDTTTQVFGRTVELRASVLGGAEQTPLFVVGSGDALGNWKPQEALAATQIAPNEWAVALDAEKISFPAEYKFLTGPSEEKKNMRWESGKNRVLPDSSLQEGDVVIYSDLHPVFTNKK